MASASKGFTKLIDIHDQALALHLWLERYLRAHKIAFRKTRFRGDGFVRYSVERTNLCCAQAGLPALRALAAGRP